jgi:hypothetical protein
LSMIRAIRSRLSFWLRSAVLLVAIFACGWLLVPRSRITWENFERIQLGMNDDQVAVILGPCHSCHTLDTVAIREWEQGRYWIGITFDQGKVCAKSFHRATPLETFKRCAEKVGIKWFSCAWPTVESWVCESGPAAEVCLRHLSLVVLNRPEVKDAF